MNNPAQPQPAESNVRRWTWRLSLLAFVLNLVTKPLFFVTVAIAIAVDTKSYIAGFAWLLTMLCMHGVRRCVVDLYLEASTNSLANMIQATINSYSTAPHANKFGSDTMDPPSPTIAPDPDFGGKQIKPEDN